MSADLAGLPQSGRLGAPAARIHPSALVADGAVLGRGVEIGPWCSVGADVTLGDGVRLVSHVVVDGVTTIGAGSVIGGNVWLTHSVPPRTSAAQASLRRAETSPG